MRLIVAKVIKQSFPTAAKAAAFRRQVGFSIEQLLQLTIDSYPALLDVDNAAAALIDQAVGRCISFQQPYDQIRARQKTGLVDFDTRPLAQFIDNTSISIQTLSVLLGCTREWLHKLLTKQVVQLSRHNADLINYVIESNVSPSYEVAPNADDGDAQLAKCLMRPIVRKCFTSAEFEINKVRLSGARVLAWEKVLAVLVAMSNYGASSVFEPDLIVAVWKLWPQSFGLKGYAEFYPETRAIRARICSPPLCRLIKKVEGDRWEVSGAGIRLASKSGFLVRRSTRTRHVSLLDRCDDTKQKRCRTPEERSMSILPSLAAIARATRSNEVVAAATKPGATRLAPFITNAARRSTHGDLKHDS